MPLRLALLFLPVLLAPALAQDAPAPPARPSNSDPSNSTRVPRPPVRRNATPGQLSPTISVNVKLVSVVASVADGDGAPYAGLQKEDFRIFEDGIEQKLAVFERESGLP